MEVSVSIRPAIDEEKKDEEFDQFFLQTSADHSVSIHSQFGSNVFHFDHVYRQSDNEELISTTSDCIVQDTYQGYNTCTFVYGPGNSGKTHILFGPRGKQNGLLYAFCRMLFDQLKTEVVTLSILEIYKEEMRDVMDPGSHGSGKIVFPVMYHPLVGSIVPDRTELKLDSYGHFCEIMRVAIRALTIMRMKRTSVNSGASVHYRFKFNGMSTTDFIDMPGSDADYRHDRFDEANLLSKTIVNFHTQVRVSTAPLEKEDVPDCNFIQLHKNAFGGNCKARMITTLSPCSINASSTLEALRYSSLCRKIQCQPIVNVATTGERIQQILDAISELKREKKSIKNNCSVVTPVSEIKKKELIKQYEDQMYDKQDAVLDKMDELKQLITELKKQDVPSIDPTKQWIGVESSLGSAVLSKNDEESYPRIVRLNSEYLFNEELAYDIHFKDTSCGSWSEYTPTDVILYGGGALKTHCSIRTSEDDELVIVPFSKTDCIHNGLELPECIPISLSHLDTLILGIGNVFVVLMYEDSIQDSWKSIMIDYFQPQDVHEAARHNSRTSYSSIIERIASISTLHENFPGALEEETIYEKNIDPCNAILESDMSNSFRLKTKLSATKMSTRHRRTSMRQFSVAMGGELDRLKKSVNDGHMLSLLVYVNEANSISEALEKDMFLEPTPAINHTVNVSTEEAIEEDQLSTDMWIKVSNLNEPGHPHMWSKREMMSRLTAMRAQYNNFVANGYKELPLVNEMMDPFYDRPKDNFLGSAALYLGAVNYLLKVDEIIPIISSTGQVNGEAIVQVVPCTRVNGTFQPYHQENMDLEEEQLQDYIGQEIQLRIKIRGLRGLPLDKNSNTFVQYQFYCDEENSRTQRSEVKTVHPIFDKTFYHTSLIHEDFIRYISNDYIELKVYGNTGTHAISQSVQVKEVYWKRIDECDRNDMIESIHNALKEKTLQLENKEADYNSNAYVPKKEFDQLKIKFDNLVEENSKLKDKGGTMKKKFSSYKVLVSKATEEGDVDVTEHEQVEIKSSTCAVQKQ